MDGSQVRVMAIGFIMVGLTRKKQGLHDKIAGTLVLTDVR